MPFVGHDLARRLEAFEAGFAADCARARRAIRPRGDAAAVAVAGGHALFLGEDSPLNEAKGLGMAGPVAPGELEAMERFFFDRGVPARVVICPLADPSLLEGLAGRGFRPVGFEDVLYRTLDRPESFATDPIGFEVAWAGPEQADACGLTIARGFTAPEEPGPGMTDLFAVAAGCEGMTSLMARVGGEPAGGASLLVRDGLAMLCGASTLPAYRNRGIQTALAHARLARAARSGCELVAMGAEPGSTSHRNAERLGFRVAYTKLALQRDPA